jgi:putative ABC transport system permease protein
VADVKTGFAAGRQDPHPPPRLQVVGLAQRMVSSGGDPMVFIPLKDAQEAQFLKDNDAIVNDRAHARPPTRPSTGPACRPARRRAGPANQQPQRQCRAGAGGSPAGSPSRWPSPFAAGNTCNVYTRADMEEILVDKLIANSARRSACSW